MIYIRNLNWNLSNISHGMRHKLTYWLAVNETQIKLASLSLSLPDPPAQMVERNQAIRV
jgi:hypothetical protein